MVTQRTWETHTFRCTRGSGEVYYLKNNDDAGRLRFYGFREPMVRVRLTEDPAGTYQIWLDAGKPERATLLAEARLFNMQFTYGAAIEESKGRGEAVTVAVEELEELAAS